MSSSAKDLVILLKKIKLEKIDLDLFSEALTHPSYNFEKNIENAPDYERLEFLGDSVLRLCLSEYLYDIYNNYDEGKLTKIRSYIVSDACLAKIANSLDLGRYLKIGVHEEKDGGREKESILACAMEAILGAIYKSSGFNKAKEFIYSLYSSADIDMDTVLFSYNSKEILQEYTQRINKDLPVYKIMNESGPAHNKTYEIAVIYHEKEIARGIGKTKKEAEKIAAFNAIKVLNINEDNHDK